MKSARYLFLLAPAFCLVNAQLDSGEAQTAITAIKDAQQTIQTLQGDVVGFYDILSVVEGDTGNTITQELSAIQSDLGKLCSDIQALVNTLVMAFPQKRCRKEKRSA
jgi:hypothetical protein